jgi:hypothetical protein
MSADRLHALPLRETQTEIALSPDDRAVVDTILAEIRKVGDVVRGLSTSLIGRANGTVYDEDGGRMGRLEQKVTDLETRYLALMTMLITLLLGGIGYFVKSYLESHK